MDGCTHDIVCTQWMVVLRVSSVPHGWMYQRYHLYLVVGCTQDCLYPICVLPMIFCLYAMVGCTQDIVCTQWMYVSRIFCLFPMDGYTKGTQDIVCTLWVDTQSKAAFYLNVFNLCTG